MAGIDYEAEYNNRARVPEHGEIFARWTRDAAAYREEARRTGRSELACSYGRSARQFIDLFTPSDTAAAPLALFIHGGYWRSLEPALFSHVAGGLNARGVAVAIAGYDLCPQVGVGDIIGQMRQACLFLWRRFGQRMLVYGHSAGGHLAACLVGTDWSTVAHGLPPDLAPVGMAISGVFDLEPLIATSMNADLRLEPAEARRVSPLFWPVGADRTLDAVVGGRESSEFLRQSRAIADAWGERGATTLYQEIPGANHFTVLDPLADPDSDLNNRLATLAARVSGSVA
jgi:arylformamidase